MVSGRTIREGASPAIRRCCWGALRMKTASDASLREPNPARRARTRQDRRPSPHAGLSHQAVAHRGSSTAARIRVSAVVPPRVPYTNARGADGLRRQRWPDRPRTARRHRNSARSQAATTCPKTPPRRPWTFETRSSAHSTLGKSPTSKIARAPEIRTTPAVS